jgi:hypothetical protein
VVAAAGIAGRKPIWMMKFRSECAVLLGPVVN